MGHGSAISIKLNSHRPVPELHRNPCPCRMIQQHLLQVPAQHRVGRVSHRPVQQTNIEAPQCISRSILATHCQRSTANGLNVLQQSQFFQHKAGIGPERHASPHGCRPRPALIYAGTVPPLAQGKRHAQACNAAAKYSDFHAEALLFNPSRRAADGDSSDEMAY